MREKRIEKEIKKAQKKGIYNPKIKLGIVGLILVIGTVIGVSYAYYTKTATDTLTITRTVSKRITVSVHSGGHGQVNSLDIATQQTDYGTTATFKVVPNEGYQYKSVSCDNNQSATYNKTTNTLTVTPRTSKAVTCIVEFERVRTLLELANEIKQKASKELSSNDFENGCPTSANDTCSGVYKMTDYSSSTSLNYNNPGGTSYYFRGDVNNHVKFAGQNWRIVRVNGDGTIRLVLDGDIGTSAFNNYSSNTFEREYAGYTYGNSQPCTNSDPCQSMNVATTNEETRGKTDHGGTNSTIKKTLETWYYNNLKNYDQYIEYGIYCNDTSFGSGNETGVLYYEAYQRLRGTSNSANPQLTCPDPTAGSNPSSSDTSNGYHTYGGVYKLKIGLLSADEIVLAGFTTNSSGVVTTSNYLYYTGSSSYFWSSSPYYVMLNYANVFRGSLDSRRLNYDSVTHSNGVRPVINLKTIGLKATGEGTKDEPFVISIN